jgi:hypothetical protein
MRFGLPNNLLQSRANCQAQHMSLWLLAFWFVVWEEMVSGLLLLTWARPRSWEFQW